MTIDRYAYYGCALTSADLSHATAIGYGAFVGNDLQSVTFSENPSNIDEKAFQGHTFKDADDSKIPILAENLAGKAFSGQSKVLTASA